MTDSIAKKIVERVDKMRSERASLETLWKECHDYTFPLRASGLSGNVFSADQAKSKVAELLTTEGTRGVRDIAAIIVGGMTPANSKWFELVIDDAETDEAESLKKASDVIFNMIHASN